MGYRGILYEKEFKFIKWKYSLCFFNYLFPSIGGMLGTSLYVLADTIFVGRSLGSQGLAALNISIPIMNIFSGLGLLLGVGRSTLISIYKGKNKNNQTHTIFTYSIISCILIGVLITFLGLYYLNNIVVFLGAKSEHILNMSKDYLQILLSFTLFFILSIDGNLGVSTYSIIANLSLFCVSIFNGLSQAIQPIVSINYGACQSNRIHETVKSGIYTSLILGLLFFIIGQLFPKQLSLMFMKKRDTILINLTTTGIRLYSISFIFMGLNSVIISYLQSMEFSRSSTFMSICRGFLMVLIGLLVFPKFFK